MAFTVSRTDGGTKDSTFVDYARLLGRQGIDLGRSPRTPEPGTGRRWLYVWDSRKQAQAFSKELKKQTGDRAWKVVEVPGPVSVGPMAPIMVQVGRRGSGVIFGLTASSLKLIRSTFPEAREAAGSLSIRFMDADRLRSPGFIDELAHELVPTLTGLKPGELERLGYVLLEEETGRTMGYVKPGDLSKAPQV